MRRSSRRDGVRPIDGLAYFRALGFLARYRDLSHEAAVEAVKRGADHELDRPPSEAMAAFYGQAEWAQISRDGGSIAVEFKLDGRPVRLKPRYDGDWLDLSILEPINRLIAPSGYQFVVPKIWDQVAYVLALTAEEQARLASERGWEFDTGDE